MYKSVPREQIADTLIHLRELFRRVLHSTQEDLRAQERREILTKNLLSNLFRTKESRSWSRKFLNLQLVIWQPRMSVFGATSINMKVYSNRERIYHAAGSNWKDCRNSVPLDRFMLTPSIEGVTRAGFNGAVRNSQFRRWERVFRVILRFEDGCAEPTAVFD